LVGFLQTEEEKDQIQTPLSISCLVSPLNKIQLIDTIGSGNAKKVLSSEKRDHKISIS